MELLIILIRCIRLNFVLSEVLFNSATKQRLGESEMTCISAKEDKSWEYTVIGLQNAWIEEIDVPDHLKMYLQRKGQTTQFYQGDDVCIDGNKRKTVVLYDCGEENRVVQFRVGFLNRVLFVGVWNVQL